MVLFTLKVATNSPSPSIIDPFVTKSVKNGPLTHSILGWSVDRNTHVFQPVISKQKMSLVEGNVCQQELRGELANRNSKLGDTFQLSESELCARGEGTCNDIDGGASLVCLTETGRWTLVGLATWDLGCNVPRVFLNVSNIETWMDNILLKVNF